MLVTQEKQTLKQSQISASGNDMICIERFITELKVNNPNDRSPMSVLSKIKKIAYQNNNQRTDQSCTGHKYPDLLLCPECMSPEISITKECEFLRCNCLDCHEKWYVARNISEGAFCTLGDLL